MPSNRSIFSKEDLLSSNLELPSIKYLAPIFKDRKFNLELLPYKEKENRKFKAKCNLCNYNITTKWPINTSNLNSHFKLKHYTYINNLEENSNLEESSNIESNSTNTLNTYFKNTTIRKRPSFMLFNKKEYKNYLLTFILNNNLPFSIVESKSLVI